ncbi:MAG: hypothetical protein HQL53_01440 [Magnetococcales bacterium]|nr:hypothetical protein [Magnetococcales bacterium]
MCRGVGLVWMIMALLLQLPMATESGAVEQAAMPRTILAFYDSQKSLDELWFGHVHAYAELPLNHLGLEVRYHDIRDPFPEPSSIPEVRGALLWVNMESLPDPEAFLRWSSAMIKAGKRFVVMGSAPFYQNEDQKPVSLKVLNQFWKDLGIHAENQWVRRTYKVQFTKKRSFMVEFERRHAGVLSSFEVMTPKDLSARSYLVARYGVTDQEAAHLVMVTPNGGYVAAGYARYTDDENTQRQWYLNPFEFFGEAFATGDLPKPETNTLSGRRMYYSHIDGDGWRSLTQIKAYKKKSALVSRVVLDEVIDAFPDFPVTVGPIAADLDKSWYGTDRTRALAIEILKRPHVELGSHTYSHPLEWGFFEAYNPRAEEPYLDLFPPRRLEGVRGFMHAFGLKRKQEGSLPDSPGWRRVLNKKSVQKKVVQPYLSSHYRTPRAYGVEPFELYKELIGSVEVIEKLAPRGKKVRVMQWSGNTSPFKGALSMTKKYNLFNINGGDTRFDREFPSVAWVSPLGRRLNGIQQVYASNSNENTYTDLWTDRFFGFKHLVRTVMNTEAPNRVKPFNVYYHMYSGERLSSLNALRANLNYARSQKLIPVHTSRFTEVVEGFFTTQMIPEQGGGWRVKGRNGLQTIRIDHAVFKGVDFDRSQGVIGQTHYQGSLYVSLDAAKAEPRIVLRALGRADIDPFEKRPYLIGSRWEISHLKLDPEGRGTFSYRGFGFGRAESRWRMPKGSQGYTYDVYNKEGKRLHKGSAQTDDLGYLTISPPPLAVVNPVRVVVRVAGGGAS